MPSSLEKKRKEFRIIYENLWTEPRIKPKPISKILKIRPSSAGKRMKEAFEKKYIMGPHLKRKSFQNFKEYVYFLHCEDPLEVYLKLSKNQNVVYLARMDGFSNLWVISKKKLDIDGVILEVGIRSDYLISYAPDCSMDRSVEEIWHDIRHFKRENYTPKGYIKTHWDQTIEWSETDEILFREFKYNFRKPLTPVMRNNHISKDELNDFMEKIPECCTIVIYFFPESISFYDSCLFRVETKYEDFIIELFSKLPTSCLFFKVSGKLFVYTYLNRSSLRNFDSNPNDVSQLHIPLILRELKKKGILQKWDRALVSYHYRNDI